MFLLQGYYKMQELHFQSRSNTAEKNAGIAQVITPAPALRWDIQSMKEEPAMMLSVFSGLQYSFSYEVVTGHYLLHDNDYHTYLQSDDTRIFREQIDLIDNLKDPENKTGLLMENTISIYL